jgi:hypothetical protein
MCLPVMLRNQTVERIGAIAIPERRCLSVRLNVLEGLANTCVFKEICLNPKGVDKPPRMLLSLALAGVAEIQCTQES